MKNNFLFFLLFPLVMYGQTPVLFFSDIDHGHRSGNNDESMGQQAAVNGDFVTVWGKNLGTSQGSSSVSINGVIAPVVYYWGDANSANFASDLLVSHGMQAVIFQIPSGAVIGPGSIYVTTGSQQSNSLPFTIVTGGKTLFISKADGSNSYNGLYPVHTTGLNGPWRNHAMLTASGKFNPGDVVYIRSGKYDTLTRPDWNAMIVTYAHDSGTVALPKAVVAYPGEVPLMSHDTIVQTRGFELSDQTSNWTIAKLLWKSNESVIHVANAKNIRIIGNGVYNTPSYYDPMGFSAIMGLTILGNYVHECGEAGNKLSHLIYYEGNGAGKSVNIGWNHLHDEYGGSGIHIYGHSTADILSKLSVHDNVIYNIPFDGIIIGGNDASANQNWIKDALVYNNVVYHTSYTTYGPWYSGIRIDNGGCSFRVFNNTVNDCNYSISLLAADSARVFNNIFGTATVAHMNYTMTGKLLIGNNLYSNDKPLPSQDPGSVCTGLSGIGFSNSGAGDLSLLSGSSAIDAGTNLVASFIFSDIAGNPRPQGAGFDIGAYEYSSVTGVEKSDLNDGIRIVYASEGWIIKTESDGCFARRIELYNASGSRLLAQSIISSETLIRSSHLPIGVYIVRLIFSDDSRRYFSGRVLKF